MLPAVVGGSPDCWTIFALSMPFCLAIKDVYLGTCVTVVASLREEFAFRFGGIKPLDQFVHRPFNFSVDDTSAFLQMKWWSCNAAKK